MQREIDDALLTADEPSAAATWRAACRTLAGPLRAAIGANRIEAADRLSRRLEADGLRTAVVGLGTEGGFGSEEPILCSHVLLWPTPYTGALGAEDRDVLERITPLLPEHRAVVLTDRELLDRVSDDPSREAEEVRTRVKGLLADGWTLLDDSELPAWLAAKGAVLDQVAAARRHLVADFLLADARERAAAAISRMSSDLAKAEALLQGEDEKLAEAQKVGDRVAAHMLSAMRRHTEQLLIDLREFLVDLEEDLPNQVAEVDDVSVVRHTLPHWLDHVVEGWVTERLADWRAAVLTDLEGFRVADEEQENADLLAPALYAAPLRDDTGWTHRLAVTAAVGGGAALFLVGLWIPAAIAVTGGLAWSAIGRTGRDEATRARLIEKATVALRGMGRDAERLLREQLDQIGAELDHLGENRAQSLGDTRSELRRELEERAGWQRARLADKTRMRDDLADRISELTG